MRYTNRYFLMALITIISLFILISSTPGYDPRDPKQKRNVQFFNELYDMKRNEKDKKVLTREIYKMMRIEFYDPPSSKYPLINRESVMGNYVKRFRDGDFYTLEELIMNENDNELKNWQIIGTAYMGSGKYIRELLNIAMDKNNNCKMRAEALIYSYIPKEEIYDAIWDFKEKLIWLLDNDDCCYDRKLPSCKKTVYKKVIHGDKEYIIKDCEFDKEVSCPLSSSAEGKLKYILGCEVRKDAITFKHIVECPEKK